MMPIGDQNALISAYQLMASNLLYDLRSARRRHEPLEADGRQRAGVLRELLQAAMRGAEPIYPAKPSDRVAGGLRPRRLERLATVARDDDAFEVVRVAKGPRADRAEIHDWSSAVAHALCTLVNDGWDGLGSEDQVALGDEFEQFLRRLERLDQLDQYRPAKRSSLTRR